MISLAAALLATAGALAKGLPAGVLLTAPRPAGPGMVRLDLQQNWQEGDPVSEPGLAVGLPGGWTVLAEAMLRARDAPGDGRERYEQRAAAVGWQPWRHDGPDGPPCDLALAAGWSDSVFTIRDGPAVRHRSGEATRTGLLHAARPAGWLTPHAGLYWSNRFFKIRRIRLDYLAAAGSLWVRAGPFPVSAFVETLQWIANPDRLDRPWSAGLAFGRPTAPFLLAFATNVYGSTLANVTSGPGTTLYGFRLSLEWTVNRKMASASGSAQ